MSDVKQLNLYNVQFMIERYARLINKFVYAYDESDAKEFVFNLYKNFEFNKDDVYCQEVDIKPGMMFNS